MTEWLDSTLIKKRHAREARFRLCCAASLIFAGLCLLVLITSIVSDGWRGFFEAEVQLNVHYDSALLDPAGTRDAKTISNANYAAVVQEALKTRFPEATGRVDMRGLFGLVSGKAQYILRDRVVANPALIGTQESIWLPLSDRAQMYAKGKISKDIPEALRKFSDKQAGWLDALTAEGNVRTGFNATFFSSGDSREAEQAGFMGSIIGSLLTMLVCVATVFPLGVMTAIYLEEFAPRNRFVDVIEVNINNLAAIPSIVFGLLGLAIYLGLFGMPRSAAVVGGLTLALMVLPTIIITTRVSIKAVPPSIREAATALGASPLQVVLHYVLPLALPGIMTGTILAVARAIGETAPLLMIGMVAFVVDLPKGFLDPATVMPVQIYLWANNPEMGFAEKASAGILTLLFLLVVMNSLAIFIRKRFECRW